MDNKFLQGIVAICAHARDQEVLPAHPTHVDAHAMVSLFLLANKFLLVMVATHALAKHQEA